MHLVSTGLATVLSDFADLEMKLSYLHKNSEATDFQFFPDSGIFVEVNKKAGIEVMKIKMNENDLEMRQIRKLKIDNVYCVACSRKSLHTIALGLSNGQVGVYNYKDTEFLSKYSGDKLNSVISLDYNASDEYIGAVQEHGLINVYGTKTSARLESITIDSNSSLVRFHPSKSNQLAIASYRGAVTAYDIHSKRKIFHAKDSHTAPCRDLCMSIATPDTLISVGFDCVINIFDIRRKGTIKLNHNHPLSTVAQSDCGTFFCVGNLKGELSTYDMRNSKTHLCLKKVHDCAVNRVAFVPQMSKKECRSSILSTNSTAEKATREVNSAPQPIERSVRISIEGQTPLGTLKSQRDSFCDFFDIQGNKGIQKTSSRITGNAARDSFDWDVFTRKPSSRNRATLLNAGSSFNTPCGIVGNGRSSYSLGDSFENQFNNADTNIKDSNIETESHISAPLREQNSPLEKLKPIKEVQPLEQISLENTMSTSSGSDKENPHIHLEVQKQIKSTSLSNETCPQLNESEKLIDYIRNDMDARLHQLEYNLKLDAERNKWEIFTQSFDLWQQQMNNNEEIRTALAVLLQTDPFVVEFRRLKEENKALKAQLENMKNMKK